MPGFNGLQQVINYMIPAVGTPRGYFWNGVLTGAPVTIDFRNVSGGGIDGQVFRPSGVFIDNTQGTGPITIVVNEIGYQMICLEGELLNLQFPAPVECTVSFVGDGQATIAFVDFPVLPYRNVASAGGNTLWGTIAGFLSDQTDLQTALDAKLTTPVGAEGEVMTYISGTWQSAIPSSGVAFQEEGSTVVTSGTLNVVGTGATVTDVGGVATLTIDSGPDLIARAGASRFVVLGTFNDSADAGSSALRNVVVSDADGRGAVSASLSVASMASIDKFSSYFEFEMDTLPTGTIKLLDFEGDSSGDAYMYMQLTSLGALQIYRDYAFSSTADSANGVIVAGTHHKVVVSFDASSIGGVIQVYVDGTLVIDSTATDVVTTESTQVYSLGKTTSSLQGTNNWYSRFAMWSTNLSPSDAAALSSNGNLTAYSFADLRQYWPLDETSGDALPDIGSGDLALINFAAWGTATAFSPAAVGDAVRVGSSGTGDFTGHDNQIAVLLATGWVFPGNKVGWQCYDQDLLTETLWNGSAWA